jgi:hypothetical protein
VLTTKELATAGEPRSSDPNAYQPGACNIGEDEVAARRNAGHACALAAVILLAVLLWTDAPAWTRLSVFLPVAGAAAGYFQAALRFCAGFGWRGVFNFGLVGATTEVGDEEARRVDREKALRLAAASASIGAAAALVSLLL